MSTFDESRPEKFCINQYVFAETPVGRYDCMIRIIESDGRFSACTYDSAEEAVHGIQTISGDGVCRDYASIPETPVQIT